MRDHTDPYTVQSPWGAVAAFFLIQCFGFVVLHGFRMFVDLGLHRSDSLSFVQVDGIGDRIMLPFWGLMWVFAFILFQADMFCRMAAYWRENQHVSLLNALRTPMEGLKAILAVVFAFAFFAFAFGHYPFPSLPISAFKALAYGLAGWGAAALMAWSMRHKAANRPPAKQAGTAGLILGFVTGAVFFILGYWIEPGLFYFTGMIGFGVMTMVTCQCLFKKSKLKDVRHG